MSPKQPIRTRNRKITKDNKHLYRRKITDAGRISVAVDDTAHRMVYAGLPKGYAKAAKNFAPDGLVVTHNSTEVTVPKNLAVEYSEANAAGREKIILGIIRAGYTKPRRFTNAELQRLKQWIESGNIPDDMAFWKYWKSNRKLAIVRDQLARTGLGYIRLGGQYGHSLASINELAGLAAQYDAHRCCYVCKVCDRQFSANRYSADDRTFYQAFDWLIACIHVASRHTLQDIAKVQDK